MTSVRSTPGVLGTLGYMCAVLYVRCVVCAFALCSCMCVVCACALHVRRMCGVLHGCLRCLVHELGMCMFVRVLHSCMCVVLYVCVTCACALYVLCAAHKCYDHTLCMCAACMCAVYMRDMCMSSSVYV